MNALFPMPSNSQSPLSVSTAAPGLGPGPGESTKPEAHDTLATAPTVWSLLDPATSDGFSRTTCIAWSAWAQRR